MTTFAVTKENKFIELTADGHAESFFLDKDGNDLVCAVVSTILQCAYAGCEKYSAECSIIRCYDGHFSFKCRSNPNTRAIIDTALIGLREAARQFPESIREKGGEKKW